MTGVLSILSPRLLTGASVDQTVGRGRQVTVPLGRDPPLGPPLGRAEWFADVDRLAHDLAVPDLEEVDSVASFAAVVADGNLGDPDVIRASDTSDVLDHRS